MNAQRRLARHTSTLQDLALRLLPITLAVALGMILGLLTVLSRDLSTKWRGMLMISVAAPAFVLLLDDFKKAVLLAIVMDIPLGLDFAIQNHGGHSGGPTGYLVSLITLALPVGYTIWIVNREPRPRLPYTITLLGLGFIFAALVSTFQSVNTLFSTFSIYLMVELFLMYVFLTSHIQDEQDLRFVMNLIALGLLLESLFMIVQYVTGFSFDFAGVESRSIVDASASVGGKRVGGTIGSANAAGSYLAPALAITFGAYLTNGKLANRHLTMAAFGLGVFALIFTLVRSSWIGFVIAMALIIWRAARTETGRKAITLLLILGFLVGPLFSGQIVDRLTKDDKGSAESRQWLAQMAQNIIRANALGVGVNNYDEVKSEKYAPRELVGHRLYVVHNKYLLVWAETGLLGLVALIAFLLAAVGRGIKWLSKANAPPHLAILLTSMVAALCGYAYNMYNDSFASRIHDQHIWFMIALIAATSQLIIDSLAAQEPL